MLGASYVRIWRFPPSSPVNRALALGFLAFVGACRDEAPLAPPQPRVVTAVVTKVVVAAPRQALEPGDSVRFTAQAFDAQGLVIPTATIIWTSSQPSVATVDARGMVIAHAAGSAQIVATADGIAGSADLSVSIAQLCECTRIVDSTATQLLQRDDSTGVYVFRAIRGQQPAIDSGSIIVGAQSGGFLRRVLRVVRAGDLITVQTSQAQLEEAVREGEFATTSITDGVDVPIEEAARRWGPWTTTYVEPSLTRTLGNQCCSLPLDGLTLSLKIKPDTNKSHPVNVSGSVDVTIKKGELVFAPRADIGGKISAFQLQNFRAIFSGDYGLNIDAYEARFTVVAAGVIKPINILPESKTFIIQQRPFATFIGPMPLVGIITKSLKLQITPSVSGSLVFTGRYRQGFGLTAGMRWSRESGWSPVSGSSSYFEAESPRFQGVKATAAVKIAIVAEYSIQFYGVAGPYVNIAPYLQGTASSVLSFAGDGSGTATGLDWETKAAVGVDLGIGAKLTILGRKDLLSAGFTIPLIKPYTLVRGFSDGPITVRTSFTGEDRPDSVALRLRPAFKDAWELGFGELTLVSVPGPPPFGRDLSTSTRDVSILPNDSVTLQAVRSGKSFKHTLAFHELAGNCTVDTASSDTVFVNSDAFNELKGPPSSAELIADCIRMGALRVRTRTTGDDPVGRLQLTVSRVDTVGSGKGTPPLTLAIPGGTTPPDTVVDKLVPQNTANGATGRYTAALDPGRRNCAVAKPASLSATITSGDTAYAEFRLTCVALGAILIRTRTSDPDSAPPSEPVAFQPRVLANDAQDRITAQPGRVGATDELTVSGLVPLYNASGASGRHSVALQGLPNRCTGVSGGGGGGGALTQNVTVFPGDTAIAPFVLRCVERVHVTTRSTGPGSDRDGYIVVIENSDGSADSTAIDINATIGIAHVRPGPHVIRLADVDQNCNAPASVNRQVSGRDSILVSFSVHCGGPPAPTGLRATQILSDRVDLAWDPPPAGRRVGHYRLYRSTAGSSITVVIDSVPSLSFNDIGLTAWTRYVYQVAAVDTDAVVGPRSAPLAVRTLDGTPPTSATNLVATAVSASQINVSWAPASDPESGINRYRIYRLGVLIDSTSATSYADRGLLAHKTYSYYVVAVNNQHLSGPPSNSATATTLDGSPPSAPTSLSATAVSATEIALAWGAASDPESGITLYRIYRGGALIANASGTSFNDTGLAPNTTYTYEVSAVNGAGLEGPRSAPASAATHTLPPTLGDLSVAVISVGSGIPAAGYQVQVSGSGVLLTQPVGPNAVVTFSGLAAQTYSVLLHGLPGNCVVDDGPNPRSVVVMSGRTVTTSFRVRCN